ncbi:aminotransferase class V-fold PLP-dependent enzyme [Oscillospiraceae bacterium PP1C4]
MKKIYLDHAATSFPKPPEVARQMLYYMENVGCNINRGGYQAAYNAAELVLDTRERLCALFGFSNPRNVIFTSSVTASLNFILKGFLRGGDHVLVSAMEHNAVIRPLVQLQDCGVSFDRIPCNEQGELLLDAVEPLIRPETKAIVMTHASNVCGTILPVEQVGAICQKHRLKLIVDCAQTAGVESIAMEKMHIDALAFTGHKGLLGPQGIGGFVVTDELAAQMTPLISGGTGSFSHLEAMPEQLPDRFEAGTPNLPAIYGLNAALCYLEAYGIDRIRAQEQSLTERFIRQLSDYDKIRVVGVSDPRKRTAVVSLDFLSSDNAEIAFRLDSEYGIMTRCGLHCAPNAHKTLHTYPQGTVRFSFGHFNTEEEMDDTITAIDKILLG